MRQLLILFISFLAITACQEKEVIVTPFTGSDANIISFKLTTAAGTTYSASIAEGNIVVSVPYGLSLAGATAQLQLCENATISPDPSLISDWESEYVFRVEAYNGNYCSYIYSVEYQENILGENVVLTTQSQVDALADSHITKIEGSLIIGQKEEATEDAITNLSALSDLTEIGVNLVINSSYKGDDLAGLEKLEKLGGLYIGSKAGQIALNPGFEISLPSLESVTTIEIASDSIAKISLPKLLVVNSALYIQSKNVAEIKAEALRYCYGSIEIDGVAYGKTSTLSLPSLESVYGDFIVTDIWGIENLSLPKLASVNGNITISNLVVMRELSFGALEQVTGGMTISGYNLLESFSAPLLTDVGSLSLASSGASNLNLSSIDLLNLQQVRGNLNIRYNSLEELLLPKLTKIEGEFTLSTLYYLERCSLGLLEECGSLNIATIPNMTTLDLSLVGKTGNITINACNKLAEFRSPKVAENVTITNASNAADKKLVELVGLDTIKGTLRITAANFEEIVIDHVKSIGTFSHTSGTKLLKLAFPKVDTIGSVTLSNLSVLTTFYAPYLRATGSFRMSGLNALTTVTLPKFESAGTLFRFYGGTSASTASRSKIENLDWFASLKSAEKVEVRYCGSLVDFTALGSVAASLENNSAWDVSGNKYNPTLQQMKEEKYIME